MTAVYDTADEAPRHHSSGRRLVKMAAREFRNGLSGFWIFIACVALGVAVITAVGALSDGLRAGLQHQSAEILGGDVAVSRPHARATVKERTFLDGSGRVSERATLRTMARLPDASDQALVELKAVDAVYPMVGTVSLGDSLHLRRDVFDKGGLAVDPILLDRFKLKLGDQIQIGDARLPILAVIKKEPDGLTDRLTYGPRVLLALPTLAKTKLVQPGTLVRWRYAVQLPDQAGADPRQLKAFRDALQDALPEAGFTIVDRSDPSPRITRTLERLRQFLTLLGLTALMVGGVGVANAVATFVDRRRKVIATMKSVGATSAQVMAIFVTQILLIALVGIALGLAVGYLIP
ncbi:MAG: FtsX-like permease family protein, partial [Alphaproteobacteria bacterium]|nr:FtsX-like permease family protein [Alphaproteobacteria bacterium]